MRVPHAARRTTPTSAFLAAVAKLIGELETRAGARCSVGVGTPGFLSPETGRILNSNLASLNGKAVDQDLSRGRGAPGARRQRRQLLRAVRGHRRRRGARRAGRARRGRIDVVFGATLGTGVGGGIVIDGRVLNGANGAAAEWSHTTLPFVDERRRALALRLLLRPPALHRIVRLGPRPGRRLPRARRRATSTRPRSAAAPPPATRPPTAPSTSTRAAWRARSPA